MVRIITNKLPNPNNNVVFTSMFMMPAKITPPKTSFDKSKA